MCIDETKKVLFLIGMGHKLDRIIKQATNMNPENIIILQSCGPVISQPFDDLMRDIIIAVYQENVEEIFVVATKDDQKNIEDTLKKIYENKELQEKIKTIDYLFQNCKPEFSDGNIREWLEGSKDLTNGIQNCINIIRHHPLIPSHVKVTELFIDKENEKLVEIDVTEKSLIHS